MKLQSTTTLLDENDRLFLELLYDDFVGLMFKHARKYFQDQVDLEDIVQQAFLRLIKYLPTIKQLKRNALAVYIVNVIRSCSLDFYRKRNISRETCFADFYEGFEEGIEDNFDLDSLMEISFSLDQLTHDVINKNTVIGISNNIFFMSLLIIFPPIFDGQTQAIEHQAIQNLCIA